MEKAQEMETLLNFHESCEIYKESAKTNRTRKLKTKKWKHTMWKLKWKWTLEMETEITYGNGMWYINKKIRNRRWMETREKKDPPKKENGNIPRTLP